MAHAKTLKAMATSMLKSRLPLMREMGEILEGCVLAVELAEELEDWALYERDEPFPGTVHRVNEALENLCCLDELIHGTCLAGVRSDDWIGDWCPKIGEIDDR